MTDLKKAIAISNSASLQSATSHLEKENQMMSQMISQLLSVETSLRDRNLALRTEHYELMVFLRKMIDNSDASTDATDASTEMETSLKGHEELFEVLHGMNPVYASQPSPLLCVPAPEDNGVEAIISAVENFVAPETRFVL